MKKNYSQPLFCTLIFYFKIFVNNLVFIQKLNPVSNRSIGGINAVSYRKS